ncbi:MAG: ThiF family adenylyltransferase [Syntrophomonadaceae bacterium]|jgi:molybdopterin/thiamine biosynthesis adenylyltransferase
MIISKDQINRYLRQVIIPEISGTGQKKLLEASVLIKAESVETSSPLLYYLAAVGVGNICCSFEDQQGYENLFAHIKDLNNDISIELQVKPVCPQADVKILLGDPGFVADVINSDGDGTPVIAAMNREWQGFIQVLKGEEEKTTFAAELHKVCQHGKGWRESPEGIGYTFSTCLLGALLAIEAVKCILKIGTPVKDLFSFDLLSMVFSSYKVNQLENILFCTNETSSSLPVSTRISPKQFCDSKVLIVGTGGLGSPAAYALVKAGIGTVGLVDNDTVDVSNLNRQILHSSSRIGWAKVDSAETFLHQLNPEVKIIKYHTKFDRENALEILNDYDVAIGGVDNFPTRYLLNDACFLMKKPMIEAGVLRFDGMGMTIIPGAASCYRCLFPHMKAPGSVPTCSETGVLGPVPGVMGFIEACEAAKLLTAQGNLLTDALLTFDGLDLTFEVMQAGKNPACPLCGTNPYIKKLQDYEFSCEI